MKSQPRRRRHLPPIAIHRGGAYLMDTQSKRARPRDVIPTNYMANRCQELPTKAGENVHPRGGQLDGAHGADAATPRALSAEHIVELSRTKNGPPRHGALGVHRILFSKGSFGKPVSKNVVKIMRLASWP